MVMQTDCTGNSLGLDADDKELESDINKEAVLEIDNGGAEHKLAKGGTGSGGYNAGLMFNSEDELDEANKYVKDGHCHLRRVGKWVDMQCWSLMQKGQKHCGPQLNNHLLHSSTCNTFVAGICGRPLSQCILRGGNSRHSLNV